MKTVEFQQGEYILSTDKRLLKINAIHTFLAFHSYWAKDIPKSLVVKSIKHSLCFGIYKAKHQIGFARVVSDFATYAYICDLYIEESHRKKGLSKWLMKCVLSHPELQNLRRITLGTRDAHELYRQFGFREPDNACNNMEIRDSAIYTKMKFYNAV